MPICFRGNLGYVDWMKYPDLINPEISRVGVAESRAYNIEAGVLMAAMARTSFGPRGMEKMYVDILGEETVTKHGGAFLRKLDVDHPAAKVVADAANVVDTHVGDGTVATAVLIGALLERARNLLAWDIPVSAVVRGFEAGSRRSVVALDAMGIRADAGNNVVRRNIVGACLSCKAISHALLDTEKLIDYITEAVSRVTDGDGRLNTDLIKIEEKLGNSAGIELVRGTVIDKPADDEAMPSRHASVRVLLLNDTLEVSRTKTDSVIQMDSPDQMYLFGRQEETDVLATVQKVVESGAGLVISRKGIGKLAQRRLAEKKIISIRRAKYNDLWWVEKATGAVTCTNVQAISPDELGLADGVYQRMVGGDPMIFIESGDSGSVTLLLRANSKRYLDEYHRTVLNTIRALTNFIEEPLVVYGGGSCEALLARDVREHAQRVPDKTQLVMTRFADALEDIPRVLAINAGMDPLDTMPALRSRCASEPQEWWGINSSSRSIERIRDIVDTCAVKRQMIKTATEAVNQILGVDDVFMKDLIDNTHCHIDGTVHAHKDPGRNHNHWEQEGLEQRQMHQYY